MTHYICPVCQGVSDHPKVCETPGCTREGHELVECNCTDGKHEGTAEATGSPTLAPATEG